MNWEEIEIAENGDFPLLFPLTKQSFNAEKNGQ